MDFDGYEIIKREIGHGGSGVVHEARASDGTRVAIKVLDRNLIERRMREMLRKRMPDERRDSVRIQDEITKTYELNVERFKDEYSYLAGLKHPNIAKVHGIGFYRQKAEDRGQRTEVSEGSFYIVSDYIDGVPIAEYSRGREPAEMVSLFAQALAGLDYIHRNGIIHLDVKSANILVCGSGENATVKIIDFGLAMAPDEYAGGFIGSVPYMAPEVALGLTGSVDARADLFSMGVVMYAAITWGRFPFPRPSSKDRDTIRRAIEGEVDLEIRPPSHAHASTPGRVPAYLDTIVMRLLAYKSEDRFYGNARAARNSLLAHAPDAFSEAAGALGSYLIPEGNRHIGRTEEQRFLNAAIDDLVGRPFRQNQVIAIEGARGLGKSHLMGKLRDAAGQKAENLSVHSISLPADEGVCRTFAERASFAIAENVKPVVVLVDNIDEIVQHHEGRETMDERRETMDEGRFVHRPSSIVLRNQEITDLLARIARLIYERRTKPDLYAKTVPVLMVVTYDGAKLPSADITKLLDTIPRNVSPISLKPLSYLDIDTYLKSTPALKGRALPDGYADAVFNRTKGIPAEIRETLSEIDSGGILFNLEGRLIFSLPPKGRQKPPATTEERLSALYRSCSDFDRRILDLLAVWGHLGLAPPIQFNEAFYFLPQPTLRQRLTNLVGREILVHRMDADAYSFVDADYFSSLIYRIMDPDEVEGWHGRILKYLKTRRTKDEGRRTNRPSSIVPRPSSSATKDVGRHRMTHDEFTHDACRMTHDDLVLLHRSYMSPSNDTYRAILALARRRMNEEGDLYTAQRLCEHALKITPEKNNKLRSFFSQMLVSAYNQEGRYALAEHIAKSAIESLKISAASPTWRTKLLIHLAGIYLRLQKFTDARRSISEAFSVLGKNRSSIHYVSLVNVAARYVYERAQLNAENNLALLECAKRMYKNSEKIENNYIHNFKARILNNDIGLVYLALGNYEEAATKLQDQLLRYQREGYHFGMLQSTMALSAAYRLCGRYDEAIDLAMQSLGLANKTYQGRWLQFAHQALAYTYHDMDRFEDSLAEHDLWFVASSILENTYEHTRASITIWNHKGHCHKELEHYTDAIKHFELVLASNPDAFSRMYAEEGYGETLFLKGDIDGAETHLDEAKKIVDKLPSMLAEDYRFPIDAMRAEICCKKGEIDTARDILSEIENLSKKNKKWKSKYAELKKMAD